MNASSFSWGIAVMLGVVLTACGPDAGAPSTVSVSTVATSTSTSTLGTIVDMTSTTSASPTSTSVFTPPAAVMPARWVGLSTERLAGFRLSVPEPEWVIEITDHSPLLGASRLRMGPDGQTYVETCCEPAAGELFMVDRSGSISSSAGVGYFPAPSSDGHWLASTNGTLRLLVSDLMGGSGSLDLPDLPDAGIPIPGTDPIALSNLAWSLDVTKLALNYHARNTVPSLLLLDPFTATSVGEATVLLEGETVNSGDQAGTAWYLPVFTDMGLLAVESQMHSPFAAISTGRGVIIDPATGKELGSVAYQPGIVVDQDTDASGHYLIYVLDDGSVHWLDTDGEGGRLAEEGFVSASW